MTTSRSDDRAGRHCAVFVSSTSEDLKEYRLAARDAALAVGLRPEMMEYFAATGGPPLAECLARVTPCNVVVAIVAERYGWVPGDEPGGDYKSITWLECEHATGEGRDLLVFLRDPAFPWPPERTEAYRLTEAILKGAFTPGLPDEVQRNMAKLAELRSWLENGRTRATYTTPEDLKTKVILALSEWLARHPECQPEHRKGIQDPHAYLEWLRDQTATIGIRGLGESAGRARNFPIEELYIPLTTTSEASDGGDRERGPSGAGRRTVGLEEALAHPRLVIVGDPGSGKTTFLRRITFAMAKSALEGTGPAAPPEAAQHVSNWLARMWAALRTRMAQASAAATAFPVFIRIADLIGHIEECLSQAGSRKCPDPHSPEWLVRFLATRSTMNGWALSAEFFEEKLTKGEAVVLLDGLDEAPEREKRERAARLFENATRDYSGARFVVTTRPQSYSGRAVLAGFRETRIEPLEPEAAHAFLDRWCRGVYPDSRLMAEQHREELAGALRAVPEIRNMTRNPVMLTALAVVHWNEKRLPEQRADLYDSILTWLSRSREQRPGREKAERCLTLLGELAFAMQNHDGGRQVRVPLEWGARALAHEFGHASPSERVRRAADFLEQEMADSGIVVSRDIDVQFWHLTFQEYLAAQAIAGQVEKDQVRLLFDEGKIYRPEWHEVALLLAGVLRVKQGRAKVDWLVSAVLGRTSKDLAAQARAAGLVGAIVSDLKPLDYEPADPRFRGLMDAVLGVFDRGKSQQVEFAARLEAAEALGQAGDPRLGQNNWVCIAGHKQVKTFDIAKYPMTIAEYQRFVDGGGYVDPQWWTAGGHGQTTEPDQWEDQKQHPNRPVTGVNWYEASAYAAWAGARLPTEAEWELAARGKEGREYPWGNEEPDATRANYRETGPGHSTPVGLYPCGATPEGVLDLAGNVWEWVEDWYDETRRSRVVRGGSWGDDATDLRASFRVDDVPEYGVGGVGFRLAREVAFP